jgi:MEMO1 family protein
MSVRAPYAAGLFYLGYEAGLKREVEKLLAIDNTSKKRAKGIIVPHAGYEYSGPTAGAVYSAVTIPKRLIILGPNHSGFGLPVSLDDHNSWKTPLGEALVDKEMINKLLVSSNIFKVSRDAHRLEHSIEVQLPFIQVVTGGDFVFTPISLMGSTDIELYRSTGYAIAQAIQESGDDVLIIASTDFTHYEPLAYAREMDAKAIEAIEEMNTQKLLETVYENDISMCGYGPVATMLFATLELGAAKAELINYSTSADFSMDESSVVGYGSMAIY